MVMEVAQHIGDHTVRCILLAASGGSGSAAYDGHCHRQRHSVCPSATRRLGRVFNVLGETIDGKARSSPRTCEALAHPP